MAIDASQLQIDELIVHSVPAPPRGQAANAAPQGLILSGIGSALTNTDRDFIAGRVSSHLARQAYDVVFDVALGSPVPDHVFSCLEQPQIDLVDPSKSIATHLYTSQTPRNSSGLLAIIRGSITGQPSLAILKIEREEGIRALNTTRNGQPTFGIQILRDLLLTQRTRVFKGALFIQTGNTLDTIVGVVSDKQRSNKSTIAVANFFLNRFLGCRLREEPSTLTRQFLDATEEFINLRIDDPGERTRCVLSTLTMLMNREVVVHPEEFARATFDRQLLAPYEEFVRKAGVPTTEFEKNTVLISGRLDLTRFDFKTGIAVIAPSETIDQELHVDRTDGGLTTILIQDQLTSVQGGRNVRSRASARQILGGAAELQAPDADREIPN